MDGDGDVFIHGRTVSSDFPVTAGAYQGGYAGSNDSYLVRFDVSGTLQYATFYGGTSSEYGHGGCVEDGNGNVMIHGTTYSDPFPTSNSAFQESYEGAGDAYIVKFDMSSSGNLLPINMADFSGEYLLPSRSVLLQWETLLESELDHFVIERSTDGIHFASIGKVLAQNRPNNYQYIDLEIPVGTAAVYYRLRIIDLNGEEESNSEIIRIAINDAMDTQLRWSPGSRQFRLTSDQQINFNYRIVNLLGKTVLTGVSATNQQQSITGLSSGLYIVQLRLEGSSNLKTYKVVF